MQLRDIASLNKPDSPPRVTPNNLQWLIWKFLIREQQLSDHERHIMRFSQRRFFQQALRILVVAAVGIALLTWLFGNYQRQQIWDRQISDLMNNEISAIPELVAEMQPVDQEIALRLEAMIQDPRQPPERVFRALLALLPGDEDRAEAIIKYLLRQDSDVREVAAAIRVAKQGGIDLEETTAGGLLIETLTNEDLRLGRILRALVLRNSTGDRQVIDPELARSIGRAIATEPENELDSWLKLLRVEADALSPVFFKMLGGTEQFELAMPLANALTEFMPPEARMRTFAEILEQPNEAQFTAIVKQPLTDSEQSLLKENLTKLWAKNDGVNPQINADISVALLRFGFPERFVESLSNRQGVEARSHTIVTAGKRTQFETIKRIYLDANRSNHDSAQIPESEASQLLRQGLLMVLAEQIPRINTLKHQEWLDGVAREVCLSDRCAACFAAAELLVKRRDVESLVYLRRQRCELVGNRYGNVFINSRLMPFALLPHWDENKKWLAVSMYEASRIEVAPLPKRPSQEENLPYVVLQRSKVLAFCELLNATDSMVHQLPPPPLPRGRSTSTARDIAPC